MTELSIKKVLYISYDGMTDPLGQSQILPYICGLSLHGYEFTLISCEKKARYFDGKEIIENICKKNNIEWHPLFYTKSPPIFSTLKDVFSIQRKAITLHKKKKFSMVHTRIGIPSIVGLGLKKKYGIKFFHDIRGFYADDRVDGEMWNLKNPIYKLVYKYFKKHELACLENADAINCLTFKAKQILNDIIKKNNKIIKEINVIPCAVDINLFDPDTIIDTEKEKLKSTFGFEDSDMVFTYLGSIGGWYLTEEMIKFLSIVYTKIPNAKFLFISPDKHDLIMETCINAGISPSHLKLVYARRGEIPILLSLSCFSVFFIKACYSKQAASPTKHGEIMAMGVPVICNTGVGDVDEIVNRFDSGIVIPNLTNDSYEKVCDEILQYHKKGKQIRAGAIEVYSLDIAIQKYLNIYKKTLGN